jgi:hypothetical protein
MPQGLRRRFWLESVLGSFTGVLAIVTIFWHDWIETIFGVVGQAVYLFVFS